MTTFNTWYREFKPKLEKEMNGKGQWDEPVISKETLTRLIKLEFGGDPRTVRRYIKDLQLFGKIRAYPSGKIFSFMDDGAEVSNEVLDKLSAMKEAVRP